MANLNVTDRNDASKYLKASGAGTDGDPHVVEHLDTNSAALLTAAQAIQTAVEILDNIVSGSEAQVDIVAALPAGTNAIGKLAANSGVDIGDVDILSIAAGDNNIGNVDIASALPAGTNAIGKLAANSGVDIGDVDVTTVPASISGPGDPTINSYAHAVVNLAASTANQTLVSSGGASTQIWVYGLFMMADTAAGTVTLQDEDDTALSGTMAVSDEGGWVLPMSGNFAMPWIKLGTDKDLEADTGACTVDGIITYAIVAV